MAALALAVAAAVHLGFQATVTLLVYPALGDGPSNTFAERHDRHGRRITPLVVVVYGALVLATGWALVADRDAGVVTAAVLLVLLLAVTGTRAAPLHGRLGAGWDDDLWRSLVRADVVRLVLAALLLAASVVPASSAI
ncbi:hypothetical protein [Solicola sp. PLA-1-18]|uniref:hypothetical protein n=1 Tax=Solicola sp. PLA-1-18 TaxID=3380532 RepID=UPI003B7FC926